MKYLIILPIIILLLGLVSIILPFPTPAEKATIQFETICNKKGGVAVTPYYCIKQDALIPIGFVNL